MLVICSVPNKKVGKKIALNLIQKNLAPCVNISEKSESFYFWEGKICKENERILYIKTKADKFDAVVECIKSLHPYKVPEILGVNLDKIEPNYAKWIDDCIKEKL